MIVNRFVHCVTEGNWKATVVTGPEEDMALTENEVLLYVYGTRDKSEAIPLGKEDRNKFFKPGATDEFNVCWPASLHNIIKTFHIKLHY